MEQQNARRKGWEARWCRGRLAPWHAAAEFALLFLRLLAGQRADELLRQLGILRALRNAVSAEANHGVAVELRGHVGDVHVELRALRVLDDPVASIDHRDLSGRKLVVHRVLA